MLLTEGEGEAGEEEEGEGEEGGEEGGGGEEEEEEEEAEVSEKPSKEKKLETLAKTRLVSRNAGSLLADSNIPTHSHEYRKPPTRS